VDLKVAVEVQILKLTAAGSGGPVEGTARRICFAGQATV